MYSRVSAALLLPSDLFDSLPKMYILPRNSEQNSCKRRHAIRERAQGCYRAPLLWRTGGKY